MTTNRVTKRGGVLLLALLLATLALAACGATPGSEAEKFTSFFPDEYNAWELDDGETVQLRANTILNKGHVTLLYEGPDDAIAYVVVEVHPTEDAAEVAATSRLREWQLDGLEVERDRAPQQATADVTQTERVRYALLLEGTTVVEIDALAAADAEAPVSDEDFADLLFIVRNAYQRMEDS